LLAAAAALVALNVKTASACGIAAYVTVLDTPEGSEPTTGTWSPDTWAASAELVTICGWTSLVHVMVP
jgi:hypothetical protein